MLQDNTTQTAPVAPALGRDEICACLRALAAFLDEHPAAPASALACQITEFAQAADDAAGTAEFDRIAAILGVPVSGESARGSRYQAARMFGPVRYRIVYVCAAARSAHDAWASYCGLVTTADDPDSLPTAPAVA